MKIPRLSSRVPWLAVPALVAILWFVVPIVFGNRTLIFRDVLDTHFFLRASLGQALRSGELPLIDPLRSGGAPLAGNPNAVPFYPDNALLLVCDTLWHLNFHFALHWLVALAGAYRLGRSWGLGREGAAGGATAYVLSGYWFSQLNLFNAVAGVALAPWLWSFLLECGPGSPPRRRAAQAGLVWGLMLLGGDPILATIALAGGVCVSLGRHGRRAAWGALTVAIGLGTLVAAPQIVETLRIYPTSYRGVFGYPETHSGTRSASTLVELFVPLFFGRPDRLGLWGGKLFGGYPPLYYSLSPGLVAMALALAAGRPRRREALVLAALAGSAVVLIYSGSTALPQWIAQIPGASAFRFFEKFALVPGLALALATGAGIQRLAEGGAARIVARAAGLLSLPVLSLWLGFGLGGDRSERLFHRVFAGAADPSTWQDGRLRWAGLAMFGVLGLVLLLVAVVVCRRHGTAAAGAALSLHVAMQSILLSPLAVTDEAAIYRSAPALAAAVPRDRVLVHGAVTRFTDELTSPLRAGELPERRQFWLVRRAQAELSRFASVADGRRLELAISPEGLDPFVTEALIHAIRHFSDSQRIAVLRATGAEVLILARHLEPEDAGGARFVSEHPTVGRSVRIYEIPGSLPEATVAGSVVRAPHVNAALAEIWAPGFDPARVAVVPGDGEPLRAPPGTVRILASSRERVSAEIDSVAGGVLILRRAFLPIWRATIDGRPAPTTIAQLTRLGVEVPAGRHTIELWISRRPLAAAGVAALAALVALAVLARRSPLARATS